VVREVDGFNLVGWHTARGGQYDEAQAFGEKALVFLSAITISSAKRVVWTASG
jgi:hypothetical protein